MKKTALSIALVVPLLFADLSSGTQNGVREVVLPVVTQGDLGGGRSFSTSIQILNLAESRTDVALAAFDNEGTQIESLNFISNQGIGNQVSLGPFESAFVVLNVDPGAPFVEGWVRLRHSDAALVRAGSEIRLLEAAASSPGGTRVLTTVRVPAMEATSEAFALPQLDLFQGRQLLRNSGYAFVNPSADTAANVTLTFLDTVTEGGRTLETTFQVPPGNRRAVFLSDVLPDLVPNISVTPPELIQLTGSLRVRSDVPVATGGIDVLLTTGELIGGLVTVAER